jgi:DTW domain-containing protein YfiP
MADQVERHRKRKPKDPCLICFLNKNLCICNLIPRLDLKTKICLVIHAKELKRTTNSGRLAVKALVNSEMRIRGDTLMPLQLGDLLVPEYSTYLFYPAEDALELTPELVASCKQPIQLIVPDGNWRQASKVHYRHHELKNIPRVMIRQSNKAIYHLRAETTDYGMSTLEAIAQALGVTEGPEPKAALLALYQAKLKATLIGRGTKL